jgi:hypothetical protein
MTNAVRNILCEYTSDSEETLKLLNVLKKRLVCETANQQEQITDVLQDATIQY